LNDQTGQAQNGNARLTFSQLLFIPRSLAFSVEVFLHTKMGDRYSDVQAAAVLLLVPLYAALWEGRDPTPLFVFLALYVAMCVRNRIECILRRGKPPVCHSRYTGLPRLMGQCPGRGEVYVKQHVEPVVVFVLGGALCPLSESLGVYLMLAAAGLFVSGLASTAVDRQLVLDINDRMIEQHERAEQFRAMRDDQP